MERGQARIFDIEELHDMLNAVADEQAQKKNASPPEVIKAAFALTFYAGLRVQEVAGLQWDIHVFNKEGEFRYSKTPVFEKGKLVLDKNGDVLRKMTPALHITGHIGKYSGDRDIPIHPRLQKALRDLRALELPGPWVIPSSKNGASQELKLRAHALKMRINRMYKALGLEKGTTHSGRRTFITTAAAEAPLHKSTLEDVRMLAGHNDLSTTQKYIGPSPGQASMVMNMYGAEDENS